MKFFAIIFCGFIGVVFSDKYPTNLPKCKYGDNQCVAKATAHIIKTHGAEGYPELGLQAIDPLVVQNISAVNIGNRQSSSYATKLNVLNTNVHGLRTAKVKMAEVIRKKNQVKGSVYMEAPKITVTGNYEVDGQLFLVPIRGKGPYNVTVMEPKINLRYVGKLEQTSNLEYIKIEKIRLTFNSTRGIFNFGNLFDNDPTLSRTVHEFINNNFSLLWDRFSDNLFDFISDIAKDIVQKVFEKIPYDEMFLKD